MAWATHEPEPGPKCPIQFPKQVGLGWGEDPSQVPGAATSLCPGTLPGVVELRA